MSNLRKVYEVISKMKALYPEFGDNSLASKTFLNEWEAISYADKKTRETDSSSIDFCISERYEIDD